MTKYFIWVRLDDMDKLEEYMTAKHAIFSNRGFSIGDISTALYSVELDRQEAVALKLSIPIVGVMEQPC